MNRFVQGNGDVWLIETARGVPLRFTSDATLERDVVWSPDAGRIVFSSNRKGIYDLYQKASSGAASEEPILESSLNKIPTDWSLDDRFLLY